jgi:hypothetical protein
MASSFLSQQKIKDTEKAITGSASKKKKQQNHYK